MYNYKNPKITVLMPVYNCELYIQEAVDSILNQTFADFEFLIIDDASTDKTVSIIKTYNDTRIKLIEKSLNTGLTNSLNYGLNIAKGEYIARMDGDDISVRTRFEKQVALLEIRPDVVVCGSNFRIIGTEDLITVPENDEKIRLELLKGNCFAHPSVMIRKQILNDFSMFYDETKEPAEDYDLWVRLISKGKLHNLQDVLLKYRVHNSQVSQKRIKEQKAITIDIRLQVLRCLSSSINEYECALLKKTMEGSILYTFNEIEIFIGIKRKMILANSNHFFEPNDFHKYLVGLYKKSLKIYFVEREKYCPIICFQYFGIRNKHEFKLRLIDELKLIIKSIIYFKRK